MSERFSGGCLCGEVTYYGAATLRPVVACHCLACRKTSGHHVAATAAPREAITIQGPVTWFQSSDQARRGFCARCGSNLFFDGGGARMSIFAGTLDQDQSIQMSGHIFCAEKGAYYTLEDGLPQAAGEDPKLTQAGLA